MTEAERPFEMSIKKYILLFTGVTTVFTAAFFSAPFAHASAAVGNSPVTSLQSGLVGYWTFDGQHTNWATGKTFDRSGKGNNGTMTNMVSSTVPVAGKTGQAFLFDGSNDKVDAGNASSVQITGAITMSTWVKWNVLPSGGSGADWQTIFSKANGQFNAPASDQYSFAVSDSSLAAILACDGTTRAQVNSMISTSNLKTNRWYHLAATWDGTTNTNGVKGYIDGVLVQQATSAIASGTDKGVNLHFGVQSGGFGVAHNGSIDETRLYNRALSAAEIQQLYNLGR